MNEKQIKPPFTFNAIVERDELKVISIEDRSGQLYFDFILMFL
jgi:hypothetical protein